MKKSPKKPNFYEKTGAVRGAPVSFPGGAGGRSKKFHSKANFDIIKKELEATGKLNLERFDNAKDLGLFLDWYNNNVEERARKDGERDIREISKLVAKLDGRKSFLIK